MLLLFSRMKISLVIEFLINYLVFFFFLILLDLNYFYSKFYITLVEGN